MSEAIKNETTEMAVASGYSAIANMDFLAEAMNDDCAGLDFKFDRIKIPSGGMTAFEVPFEDGEGSDLVKEIEAVILYSHPANSYYTEAYKGGSNPPDCGSFDGITGTGTPGGICKNCPFNQFGSGEGKSKACKNRRMLYLLRENEIFPLILNLPTGSLKGFTKYVQTLLARGKRPNQVVTKISLRKAASASFFSSLAAFRRSAISKICAFSMVVFLLSITLGKRTTPSIRTYTRNGFLPLR